MRILLFNGLYGLLWTSMGLNSKTVGELFWCRSIGVYDLDTTINSEIYIEFNER